MTSNHAHVTSNLRPLAASLLLIYAGVHTHELFAAVTSCADDGGADTLRHAVLTANPGDTIDLSKLACSKITLQGAIDVALDDLTIQGPGAANLTIDGNQSGRVFTHAGKGTLTLTDVTIANGLLAADSAFGGCIYSKANVALTRATVTSCQAKGQTGAAGGGILTLGDLTLDSSVLSNNVVDTAVGTPQQGSALGGGAFSADQQKQTKLMHSIVSGNSVHTKNGLAQGGGIVGGQMTVLYSTVTDNQAYAESGKGNYGGPGGIAASYSLFMLNSTVDHNRADVAGGILIGANSGWATIVQSTISSNQAKLAVGGIDSGVKLSIGNSTIAFNSGGAQGGGGILQAGAFDLTMQSTILADNAPTDLDGGTNIVGSHNLIKILGPTAPPVPMGTLSGDPQLGPLAYNGGTTRTHALLPGSPAIDAGNNPANLQVDQRGGSYARTVGGTQDIGAYEFDADKIFGDGFGGS